MSLQYHTDRAISQANAAFLSSPAEQEQARLDGEHYSIIANMTPEQRAQRQREGLERAVLLYGNATEPLRPWERASMLRLIRAFNRLGR